MSYEKARRVVLLHRPNDEKNEGDHSIVSAPATAAAAATAVKTPGSIMIMTMSNTTPTSTATSTSWATAKPASPREAKTAVAAGAMTRRRLTPTTEEELLPRAEHHSAYKAKTRMVSEG